MSKIYFIADTHLSHNNIIKYCNRPFNNIADMNETIINNWNKVVTNNDIVYHLGDFTINHDGLKEVVSKLNGKIYLIRGNHDGKSIKFYNNIGLEVLPTQTKLDKYKLILSHKPLMDKQIPIGYKNIHGHIHNVKLNPEFNEEIHICVSVEMINYKPISISEVKTYE